MIYKVNKFNLDDIVQNVNVQILKKLLIILLNNNFFEKLS